jgi:hypothetical protein
VFISTRLAAHLGFGLGFDSDIRGFWHVLDVGLLRDDLLRSLAYLHAQPPLYNLLLGVVLKTVPASATHAVFEAVFLAIGFAGILGIHALILELGAPRGAALAAAALQTLSTTWIVYESWLFYTLPTAALLTWSAVWAARVARGGHRSVAACALAVVAIAWLRSTYHLVWVVGALAVLLAAARRAGPALVSTARLWSGAALVLVLALYVKNACLVGAFASSSWLGMNLARMTVEALGDGSRDIWVKAGALGPVARVPAFSPLKAYPAELQVVPPGTPWHPSLVDATKADGSPNYNHVAYVGIGRAYMRAAAVVVRRAPELYVARVREALGIWLRPPTEYEFVDGLRRPIRKWDRLHSRLALWAPRGRGGSGPCWVLLAGAALVGAALFHRPSEKRRQVLLLIALPLLSIAFNLLLGCLFEVGENNRFRVEIEGLMASLGSWGALDIGHRLVGQLRGWRNLAGWQ